MGIIARQLVTPTKIDYPTPDSLFIIEDNPGDYWPIHVHMGKENGVWKFRLHFTYDEFREIAESMIKEKEEYGFNY